MGALPLPLREVAAEAQPLPDALFGAPLPLTEPLRVIQLLLLAVRAPLPVLRPVVLRETATEGVIVAQELAFAERVPHREPLPAAEKVGVVVKPSEEEALSEAQPEAEAVALRQALAENEGVLVAHGLA